MKRRRRIADIAVQRIDRLFALAEAEARAQVRDSDDDRREQRCDRYIHLARVIGMRYRVRIPGHLKIRICKRCYALLIPGRNARVRLRGEYITATCLRCGKQMRRPYKAARAPSVRMSKNTKS
ncbi:MAG: ribonuclease P [Methanophagales archaeon]|nr:ribonuclease P [Methanophagales archaeon]